jgi:hypothetical protein
MIDLKRKRPLGDTVADFIETLSYAIDGDGESLWHIVPAGDSFGFTGADLSEFVRMCVSRLLEAGAVPVRHSPEGAKLRWTEQTQYGSTPDEIADAIVAEWLRSGGGDPTWEYLWFVTRRVFETDTS